MPFLAGTARSPARGGGYGTERRTARDGSGWNGPRHRGVAGNSSFGHGVYGHGIYLSLSKKQQPKRKPKRRRRQNITTKLCMPVTEST